MSTPALIAVVDYCKGNLRSAERGLVDAGYDARITADPADIRAADGILLPGVGSWKDAMTTMDRTGQTVAIRDQVAAGVPFLGICLGLQLLFEWGDEGCAPGERVEGLALLPGHIERVPDRDERGRRYKVPHVGWNSVEYERENALFEGIDDGSYFYFTHSYHAVVEDRDDVTGTTCHSTRFVSAVCHDNIFGMQFHPEKSSAHGLRMLANFGKIVEETR